MKTAVLGSGAWGTTFGAVLADAGCDVTLWGRDGTVASEVTLRHSNERFLPGITLPELMVGTTDAHEALADAEIVAVALPSQKVRAVIEPLIDAISPDATIVSLMKGVELASHMRMSEVLAEVWRVPRGRVAVVSGPNLAKEIAAKQPTATVVAASTQEVAERVARATASGYFRPYTNTDVLGVELSGAYKNIIAVAVGIAGGMGFGHNTTATVITRGLAEITRLGLALGARPDTFSGLAGMGDLIATCASPLSRNHTLGAHIGSGAGLQDAIARTGGTAEGVTTCQSIQALARDNNVDVPICDAVVAMLHEGHPKEAVLGALLSRPRKAEGA